MEETWKAIEGFSDYAVSNYGQVMRAIPLPPRGTTGGRGWPMTILKFKGTGRKREYAQVTLCRDGLRYYRYVHILVAQAFIPNPEHKPTVNHGDGVKPNNRVDNLSWATYAEQTQHGLTHDLIVKSTANGQFI